MAAVAFRPKQEMNKILDQKKNVLLASGILTTATLEQEGVESINELFESFQVRYVDLDTGDLATVPERYDHIKAAKDPKFSRQLSNEEDIATIRRRERYVPVYLKYSDNTHQLDIAVFPVRGYGLWGTLYGYLALQGDLQTIAGLAFYKHQETPGLGGEVDNPTWKEKWNGVLLFNDAGEVEVNLVKKRSSESNPAYRHEVDALSGATLTTQGVEKLVRFWFGPLGFQSFLERISPVMRSK